MPSLKTNPGVGYKGAAKLFLVNPNPLEKSTVFRFSIFINAVKDLIRKLKKASTVGRLLMEMLSWGKNFPITGE